MTTEAKVGAFVLACLAILMNALAPSISHAMSSNRTDTEICRAPTSATKSAPLKAAAMPDCGYCLPLR